MVTGASRGIGLAVSRRLGAEGARVLITAKHQDQLDEALASLGDSALARALYLAWTRLRCTSSWPPKKGGELNQGRD